MSSQRGRFCWAPNLDATIEGMVARRGLQLRYEPDRRRLLVEARSDEPSGGLAAGTRDVLTMLAFT